MWNKASPTKQPEEAAPSAWHSRPGRSAKDVRRHASTPESYGYLLHCQRAKGKARDWVVNTADPSSIEVVYYLRGPSALGDWQDAALHESSSDGPIVALLRRPSFSLVRPTTTVLIQHFPSRLASAAEAKLSGLEKREMSVRSGQKKGEWEFELPAPEVQEQRACVWRATGLRERACLRVVDDVEIARWEPADEPAKTEAKGRKRLVVTRDAGLYIEALLLSVLAIELVAGG